MAERGTRGEARPATATGRGLSAHHGAGMALVTVTHNSAATVERLLRSVELHLPGARVIVVDSGSTDGSATAARAAAPRATVIELGENVGFGRASNAGVAAGRGADLRADQPRRRAGGRLAGDARRRPARAGRAGADAGAGGAVAGRIAPGDRPPRPRLPAALGEGAGAAGGAAGAAAHAGRSLALRSAAGRVGWAVGACLVAPTATLRRLGPFDERIFLFGEDLDLGLRAADAGVETVFRPDARVVHLDAQSTEPAFGGEPFELLARQRRAVIGERRGADAAERDDQHLAC